MSQDDVKRVRVLTDEVRTPPVRLTIVETPTAVTLTDEQAHARTFHPNGKGEVLQVDGVPVAVIAKWEAGRLVVVYTVEQGRELRYTYQQTPVLVQVSLLHKGGISGGGPAVHADGVLRGVQEYVDQFATRIRDANK